MSSPNPPFELLQFQSATDCLAAATTVVQLLSVQYKPIRRLQLPPLLLLPAEGVGAHPQPRLPPPPPPLLLLLLLW